MSAKSSLYSVCQRFLATILFHFCVIAFTRAARVFRKILCINPVSRRDISKREMACVDENVLDLNVDPDTEQMVLGTGSNFSTKLSPRKSFSSAPNLYKTDVVTTAEREMLLVLKQIRDSQASLCTKDDLRNEFKDMDRRVTSNTSSLNNVSTRIVHIESTLETNKHETELVKQSMISCNLSIMGVPPTSNEKLSEVATNICTFLGIELSNSDVLGSYRVNRGNSPADIFVVKLKDFSMKHRILKSKVNKVIRLSDIGLDVGQSRVDAQIYVNNHVTPFFGRLLAEGRKAVKDKKAHSVWLNRDGCRLRFDEAGRDFLYRSTKELANLVAKRHQGSDRDGSRKRTKPDDDSISPSDAQKAKK